MKDDEDQQFVIIQFSKCRQRNGYTEFDDRAIPYECQILNTYKLGSAQILSTEKNKCLLKSY